MPLVQTIAGQPMADSRHVADFFERAHKNVLQSITNAAESCTPEFAAENFQPIYVAGRFKPVLSHYMLTRDGFSFSVLSFTGQKAARFREDYIRAFNAMAARLEQERIPDLDDNATLRRLLMGRVERIEVLEAKVVERDQQLAIAAPKVEAFDAFMSDDGTCNLRTVARVLRIGPNDFFDWIKRKRYVHMEAGALQPRADLAPALMRVIFHDRGGKPRPQTVVTRPGVEFLRQHWTADQLIARRARERAIAAETQPRLSGI